MTQANPPKDRTKRFRLRKFWRLLVRFGPHLHPYRKALLGVFACMLAVTAMELARPWPIKLIFDEILMPERSRGGWFADLALAVGGDGPLLAVAALSILLIALVGGLFGFGQAYLMSSVSQRVGAAIRLQLFSHIQRLSQSFHDERSTGDMMARLTGDVGLLRQLLVDTGIFMVGRLLLLAGAVVVMALMDWRLTVVALLVLLPLVIVTARLVPQIKGAARKQRRREGQIAQVMTEGITSIRMVQAYAQEAREEQRFARQIEGSTEASLTGTRLEAHLERLVQVILAFGTCAVVWYGVVRVQSGVLTPGDLLVFTSYLAGMYKPIRRLASISSRIVKATVCGERVAAILDLEPEVKDRPDAKPAPVFKGEIAFDHVVFGYRPDRPILRAVDFRIGAGETVALMGESGSGKSTIASLLLRFYEPSSGRIRIDDVEIGEYALESLRRRVAIVLQDTMLFRTSIRENIAYGRLDATMEEIADAARAADAHDFIEALPDGYETVVGERGSTLSGGQRQRIAIARAMIRNAAIVILDEPMVGLDTESEASVRRALKRLVAGRTCLVITHDPRGALDADRVLALSDGLIADATNAVHDQARAFAAGPAAKSAVR
ncbi:MAG: ABC transporter ATP-binding protein/permease [Minwuiales bacterium]|nr:ABC transporter ATP-binding protein/permease [Minwuiales bacterium]